MPAMELHESLPAVLHHHERWDGTGYPERLAGTDIPKWRASSRSPTCGTRWCSDRAYRAGLAPEAALAHITAGKGAHFDPAVVAAFITLAADWGYGPAGHGDPDTAWQAAQTCHEAALTTRGNAGRNLWRTLASQRAMNKMSKRSCARSVCPCWSRSRRPYVDARPRAAPSASPQTQTVVGGGIGTESVIPASLPTGRVTTRRPANWETARTLRRLRRGHHAHPIRRHDHDRDDHSVPFPYDCGPYDSHVECFHAELMGTGGHRRRASHDLRSDQGPVVNQSVKRLVPHARHVTLRHRTGCVMVDAGVTRTRSEESTTAVGAPASGVTDVELTPVGQGLLDPEPDGRVASFGDASPSNAVVTLPQGQHRFVRFRRRRPDAATGSSWTAASCIPSATPSSWATSTDDAEQPDRGFGRDANRQGLLHGRP